MSLAERYRASDSYGLLLAMIFCAVLASAAGGWAVGRLAYIVLLGATLLFALRTSNARRRSIRVALFVAVLGIAVAVVAGLLGSGPLEQTVASTVSALLILSAVVAIVRRLLQHTVVAGSTILGALSVYLLIGLLFASVFGAIGGVGTFFAHDHGTSVDYLYFSFVTLTTVGYGDLTAVGNVQRLLAATEALTGQLYLVSIVALVVGNIGRVRPRVREGDPSAGGVRRGRDADPPG
jgi:hypothetical protein